jgi:ketosteroid isomerase-like protein
MSMVDLKGFQRMLQRQRVAIEGFYQGDPEAYLSLYAVLDPVSAFDAFGGSAVGWHNVAAVIRRTAARFSQADNVIFEVAAIDVGTDMAYTVGYERCDVSIDRGPLVPVTIRATHTYRMERGDWRIAHRAADFALA